MDWLLGKYITKSIWEDHRHVILRSKLSSVTSKINESIEIQKRKGLEAISHTAQNIIGNLAVGLEKINMDLDSEIVTLEDIKKAYKYLHENKKIVRTPTLMHVQDLFTTRSSDHKPDGITTSAQILDNVDLYLKMENMQTTGSFKIRGAANQMRKILEKSNGNDGTTKMVTFSAGNYGKAFAHCLGPTGIPATCIMPETVPSNRISVIKGLGVDVKLVPKAQLSSEIETFEKNGYQTVHSFNDLDLIAGNGSAGLELLEDVPNPDVVLVCCGGGGLVSGVGAAISLSGLKNCRVYAVEPEGASTMYESFKNRRPVTIPDAKSVASGLSPPYAGSICYKHCRWFVEDVLLVSDEEILSANRALFHRGIKAEPSGCAALAALLSNKVPDIKGKKVAVFITGGNVTSSELVTLMQDGSS